MSINFIPDDVLTAPVDLFYFISKPLASAWHNFKVAFSENPTPLEVKTQDIANNTLKETSVFDAKTTHFISHFGVGVLLTIPIFNAIPFAYLVIKIKENLNPNAIIKEPILSQVHCSLKEENEDVAVTLQPKITPKVEPSEINLSLRIPVIPIAKATESTSLTKTISAKEPLQRTNSLKSPRILDKMNVFQHKPQDLLSLRDSSPPKNDGESLRLQKIIEDDVTVSYFILFPEQSTEQILRKAQKTLKPVIDERTIVDNLILNFPGHLKQHKFLNAQANLKTLRAFLIKNLGDVEGNYWIRETLSHDVQVQTKDNPYEIVRKGIFSCPQNSFLDLISKYIYTTYKGTIVIRDNLIS
jgi:hypothetical protein